MTGPIKRAHGATLIEFLVGVVGVLLPLALGTLQLALLTVDRHQLNLATQLAVRAAALEHGSMATLRRELARGLAPMFGDKQAMAQANAVMPVATARAVALAEVLRPDLTRITVLNPTAQSFVDFERTRSGIREIPDGAYEPSHPMGTQSRQTLLDANTLSVRVTYCARLIVPLVDRVIPALLAVSARDALALGCYAERRIPMTARAIVPMHSTPRRAALGL